MKNFFVVCVDANAIYANFTESHLEEAQNFQSWVEMANLFLSFVSQPVKIALIP